MESQVTGALEAREARKLALSQQKAQTQEIIEKKIRPAKSRNQRIADYNRGKKKGLPAVRRKSTSRPEVDTISMGYDRFLEDLPADVWKYLPHTFASVMSDGQWTPFRYLVMISHILATVIGRGGGRVLVSIPPRHGKLIADNTRVPTPKGWKQHGELRRGDYVFGRDGHLVKVLGVSPKATADCMVVFSDGQKILAHENHEWIVRDRSCHKERIFETKYFLEHGLSCEGERGARGHRNRFQVDANVTLDFQEQELPIHPYFLGVWLGDGRSSSPDFCGAATDVAIVDRLKSLGYQTSSRWTHKTTGVCYYYYSDIKKILQDLDVLNNKHIPDVYLFSSVQQRMDLLAGLVDTDGHRDPHGRYRISTCNEKITHQIKALVNSLGGRAYIMSVDPIMSSSGIQGKQVVYQVGFNLPHVLPVALERKSNKDISYVKRRRAIVDVYRVKSGEIGHCIQVEGGVYLVGETMIPTHNSFFISQWLPAWFLANWPNKRVILASYEANFAATWGRRVRNIIEEKGDRIGVSLAKDATASNNWMTMAEGGMMTAGVGGPITGKGGDLCVTGDTIIATNIGIMTINDYFSNYTIRDNILCLSYDHSCDRIVFSKIIARRELTSHEIFQVNTSCGRKLRLTGEHPIYDRERGYRPTRDLLPGDGILCTEEITEQQDLCDMRKTKRRQGVLLSRLLQQSKEVGLCSNMQLLWERIREITIRSRKSIEKELRRCLLFGHVQSGTSCHKKFSSLSMQGLRDRDRAGQDILQSRVQASFFDRTAQETKRQNLSGMSGYIHPNIKSHNILRSCLQKLGSFFTDDWPRQFTLQNWYQLREEFQGDASTGSRKGWVCLCALWKRRNHNQDTASNKSGADQFANSSHGPEPMQQYGGQPGYTMRSLPCDPPSLVCDSIQGITRDCTEEYNVYDIEVEGTNNFFANGILVHNCIIDDPHKNWQEAQSATTRNSIKDWFDSTFYTRLEPQATAVVLQTRWHEDDLIGYLMREKTEDGWFHIRIPAIAENWNGEEDVLGREPGQSLCPERYDEKALNRIKANMSPMMWNALFQQRPAPMEGSIFLRSKWNYYKIRPKCSFVLQSWDTAHSKNKDAAFTVCQTWGISDGGAVLIDQWRDRVEYPQLRRQVEIEYLKHRPNVILIEDKDSGQALCQALKQETILPVLPIIPDMDKVVRAQAVSPMQEAGRCWLPEVTSETAWVGDLVDNCATFPNALYKDEIDAMSQALAYIMTMAMGGRILSMEKRRTSRLLNGYRDMM